MRSPARLEDPTVVEVMLSPDGWIWIDRLTDGLPETGAWKEQKTMWGPGFSPIRLLSLRPWSAAVANVLPPSQIHMYKVGRMD
jgi:hypothetical protein